MSKEAVLAVLTRAAHDDGYIAKLTHHGGSTLQGLDLSREETVALLSGDMQWLEAHVGNLNNSLRTWPDCRLQQEIW
jgi:hypothetical protein